MAVTDHSPDAVEQRAADLQRARSDVASIPSEELFRSAMADDPPAPAPEQPPPQQPEPQRDPSRSPQDAQAAPQGLSPPTSGDRQRDEHGRFLPSTPAPQAPLAPAAATQQQPGQPAVPEEALIPSWRLREERERREEIAQQLAYERDARIRYEQQLMTQQRAAQAQQEQVPDVVADPAGYHYWVMNKLQQQHQEQQANLSFRLHHWRHGDAEFFGAYNEMLARAQRGDPSVVQQVMASPDPGARMMDWYRDESQKAKLGTMDLDTYAEKVWYPQHQARLAQGGAAPRQQANGQAAQATFQVPPSLSRIPGAAANGTGGDMSDPSLFAYAMRGGR
jgi:hypothetical protein